MGVKNGGFLKRFGHAFWRVISAIAVISSVNAFAGLEDGVTVDPAAEHEKGVRAQADKACALLVAHVANGEKVSLKDLNTGLIHASSAAAPMVSSCAKFSSMCAKTAQELAKRHVTLSDLQCQTGANHQVAGLCVEDYTMSMGHPAWLGLGPQYRCVGAGWVRSTDKWANETQCQISCVGGPGG